ncbi:uncharacterized protein LOC142349762 [Convolutriloba macropyga]|uniref:uncharacterized protein LOC142349762 n=1 Tax=Convolutriloba macropyga TaxID=536237 RepID=UPI003F51D607
MIYLRYRVLFVMVTFSLMCDVISEDYIEGEYSLDFQIPNKRSDANKQSLACSKKSASFCFLRMTFAERQTAIEFGPGQREAFEYLIPPVYSLINWIPLDDSQEECCGYQSSIFMEKGERFGVRAVSYIHLIVTYFQTSNKALTYVKAQFNSLLCKNVISEVGYGRSRGEVRIEGDVYEEVDFVFPPNGRMNIFKFKRNQLRNTLTYAWFKQYVICQEKTWVCKATENSVNSWLFREMHSRWIKKYGLHALGRLFGYGWDEAREGFV